MSGVSKRRYLISKELPTHNNTWILYNNNNDATQTTTAYPRQKKIMVKISEPTIKIIR